MQALMLAAGMGKRLGKMTKNNTKCMLEIQGKTLIERSIEALLDAGVTKMYIVVGYKGDNLKKFLTEECDNPRIKEMELHFIDNDVYDKTNNIYSLFLGKDVLVEDDTILLESDLIYEPRLIKDLVDSEKKNAVTVAKYEQWMDGTVIKIGEKDSITEFIEKSNFNYGEIDKYYKTVNIYKFSKEFSEKQIIPFLKAYIEAYGKNEYYELILKIIAHLSRSDLKALDIGDVKWYEMDDAQDVDIVNSLFAEGKDKLVSMQKRFGGYWRFENLEDYCYLVNPYYPPKEMYDKIKCSLPELISQYPSGQYVQALNAARLFGDIDQNHIVVGNGAAELINILGGTLSGDMYVCKTAFNEYVRCFRNCTPNIYDESKNGYKFNVNEIMANIPNNNVICIVNPDNPTGAFIEYDDIIRILDECEKQGSLIIFDESFIDFVDKDKRYTLIKDDILDKYRNLIVVKSISKSYGIPGLRLGVVATSNEDVLSVLKTNLPVWNINSIGEYYLQIANLYKKDYAIACDKIAEERTRFINALRELNIGTVYDSQANYVLIDLGDVNSTDLAIKLLNDNIFIKDLRTKHSFEGTNFVRIAIKSAEENDKLLSSLKKIINGRQRNRE